MDFLPVVPYIAGLVGVLFVLYGVGHLDFVRKRFPRMAKFLASLPESWAEFWNRLRGTPSTSTNGTGDVAKVDIAAGRANTAGDAPNDVFEVVLAKVRAEFVGGNREVPVELWSWALDRPTNDRVVRVRSLFLEDPTEKSKSLTAYREFKAHVDHLERCLNYLTAGKLTYATRFKESSPLRISTPEPDALVTATEMLHDLTMLRTDWGGYEEFWVGPSTLEPDIRFRLPESDARAIHENGYFEHDLSISSERTPGLPSSRPVKLEEWFFERDVWRHVVPAVVFWATDVTDAAPKEVDITDWVFSDRQLSRFRTT